MGIIRASKLPVFRRQQYKEGFLMKKFLFLLAAFASLSLPVIAADEKAPAVPSADIPAAAPAGKIADKPADKPAEPAASVTSDKPSDTSAAKATEKAPEKLTPKPVLPPSTGQITFLTGEVEVLAFGKQKWEPAAAFQKLNQGDSIRTKKGKAELTFEDKSRITLKEDTSIDLTKLKDTELKGDTIVKLWLGKIRTKFTVSKNLSTLQIQTKHVVAAVKGTDFITEANDIDSKVTVFEGIVSMADPLSGKELFIKAGDYATYMSSIMGQSSPIPSEQRTKDSEGWDNKPYGEEAPAPQQKAPEAPAPAPEQKTQAPAEGGLDATFGAVTVDGKTYYMMSFGRDLALGKFGLGIDLRLLWNDDGIKQDDWNNLGKSLENMFKYVRYGQKGEDVYIKLGILKDASLGHGFLIRRYSNVGIDVYTRKFGTQLDLNLGPLGIETLTNDIAFERLYAGRVYFNVIPRFLQVGVTGIYDANPAKDKVGAGNIPIASSDPLAAPLTVYGADAGISLINTDFFSVLVYGDWAKYKDHGEGMALPGVAGKLAMFDYRAEYRIMDADFIPNLFDQIYEDVRPVSFTNTITYGNGQKKKGAYGELTWNFGTVLALTGAYEKFDGLNPYVRAEAVYKGNFIPKVSLAAVGFEQNNAGIVSLKDPSAVAYAKVGVDFAPNVVMVFIIRQTYDPLADAFNRSTMMAVQLKL